MFRGNSTRSAEVKGQLHRLGAAPTGPSRSDAQYARARDAVSVDVDVRSGGKKVIFRAAEGVYWDLRWEGDAETALQLLRSLPDGAGVAAFWRAFAIGSAESDLLTALDRVGVLDTEFTGSPNSSWAIQQWRQERDFRAEMPADVSSATDLVWLAWRADETPIEWQPDGRLGASQWWGRMPNALSRLSQVPAGGGTEAFAEVFLPETSELRTL
jgi:hypothetical protein